MTENNTGHPRSRIGYGSSYHRGKGPLRWSRNPESAPCSGGQVWVVKPDKKAQADNPCLWMQSGAVKFKSCNNYYDCTTCKYDHAMQAKVSKGKTDQLAVTPCGGSRPGAHLPAQSDPADRQPRLCL